MCIEVERNQENKITKGKQSLKQSEDNIITDARNLFRKQSN